MNAKAYFAVSALSLLAATSAFAAEGTQEFTNLSALSSKSRAEVVAQIGRADAAAQYIGEASAPQVAASTLPRVQVVAEAREALRLGLIGPSEVVAQPTTAQAEQIRQAGVRAAAERLAGAK